MPTKELPPSWMIISSLRYSLGRVSVASSECSGWLKSNWTSLPWQAQALIQHDIRAELDRVGGGGMQMDRDLWESVLDLEITNAT